MRHEAKSSLRKTARGEIAPGESVAPLWDHGADLIVQLQTPEDVEPCPPSLSPAGPTRR
jgi:hypothetical protein